MTAKLDTQLMPAQNPTNPSPTTGIDREEVKAVALYESRKARKRAWDELSEVDRAVLLESVRQRRRSQEQQRQIYTELFGLRTNR